MGKIYKQEAEEARKKNKTSENSVAPKSNPIPIDKRERYYKLAEKYFKENPSRKTFVVSTEDSKIYFKSRQHKEGFQLSGFYWKKTGKLKDVS